MRAWLEGIGCGRSIRGARKKDRNAKKYIFLETGSNGGLRVPLLGKKINFWLKWNHNFSSLYCSVVAISCLFLFQIQYFGVSIVL